jgi:hypothetical protein
MQSILLEVDDEMARQLEKVAPAKTRSRSRFIRLAIQKALMDLQDLSTRTAYADQPEQPASFDASTWSVQKPRRALRRKR